MTRVGRSYPSRPDGQDPWTRRRGAGDLRRRRIYRRRRGALAAAVLLCAAGVVAWLLAPSSPGRRRAPGTQAAPPPSSRARSTAAPTAPARTTTTRPAPSGPAAVGSTTITVSDARGPFPVQLYYPADRPGAPSLSPAGAPFPLIVFSPGFDIDPAAYTPLMESWAAARYVVAEPRYRGTAPGDGLDEADIVNHPTDLHAVVDQILAMSAQPSGLLAGMVDPTRVGAAGHSDGGDVTDAVVANSCCRDTRIKAAEVLAGAELTSFDGAYSAISVPVLVVQGDADPINAPACSEQIYGNAGATRFYLDLHGAGHHSPYLSPQFYPSTAPLAATYRQAVQTVSGLFWQAYLRGDAGARSQLSTWSLAGSPAATLFAGTAVPVQGACLGAPAEPAG